MSASSSSSPSPQAPHHPSFTLLDWFHSATPSSSSSSNNPNDNDSHDIGSNVVPPSIVTTTTTTTSSSSPAILLMDGGVSTHLEGLIAPNKFTPRSLWSSSLLLTPNGQSTIVKGHQDWLKAGVNIITTVTYQCHYGLLVVTDSDDHDAEKVDQSSTDDSQVQKGTRTNNDSIGEECMTRMIHDGITLARLAIRTDDDDGIDDDTGTSSSPGPYVVASTGPYGAAMADGSEYTGIYPPSVTTHTLRDFHRRKARAMLFDGTTKPDGLAVETIPNLDEVAVVCQVLIDLLQELDEERDVVERSGKAMTSALSPSYHRTACWISFACRNGHELNDGHTVQKALDVVRSYDPTGRWINAVGVNCCDSIHIQSLVKILTDDIGTSRKEYDDNNKATQYYQRGIVLYPNSGEAWDATHEEWKDGTGTTDVQFADRLMDAVQVVQDTWDETFPRTLEANIDDDNVVLLEHHPPLPTMPKIILGGCCRTNPATIATLKQRIDVWNDRVLIRKEEER